MLFFKKTIEIILWLFVTAMIPLGAITIVFIIFITIAFSPMVYNGLAPEERLLEHYNDYMQVVKIFKSGKWPYEVIETSDSAKQYGHYDKYVLPKKYHHLVRHMWFRNPDRKLFTIEGDINNPNSELLFPIYSYDPGYLIYTPIKNCNNHKNCIRDYWYSYIISKASR